MIRCEVDCLSPVTCHIKTALLHMIQSTLTRIIMNSSFQILMHRCLIIFTLFSIILSMIQSCQHLENSNWEEGVLWTYHWIFLNWVK